MARHRKTSNPVLAQKDHDGRPADRSTAVTVHVNVAACIWPLVLVVLFAAFLIALPSGKTGSISAAVGPVQVSLKSQPERDEGSEGPSKRPQSSDPSEN